MDAHQFTMWLQGFAELSAEPPTKEQWQSIREHLQTVFIKVTPPVAPSLPKIDLKDSVHIKKLLEEAQKQNGALPQPIYPPILTPYWLDSYKFRPGDIIC